MPTLQNKKTDAYEITVGPKVKVIEDRRTRSRVANFPFEFSDGAKGIVIICKLEDKPWNPSDDINKLILLFHE